MKYIVPLFRQNTGRVNLGLVNWDSFQAGFRMLMRGDKFAGVTWDPWWRERKSGERRKGNDDQSPSDGHMTKLDTAFLVKVKVSTLRLVPGRRTNWKGRSGNDRRKSTSRDRLVGLAAFSRELIASLVRKSTTTKQRS